MTKQIIIGLVGHKGTGKSSIAQGVKTRNGWVPQYLKFAEPIYTTLRGLGVSDYALDNKQHWDSSLPILGNMTLRQAAQNIGDDLRATFGKDVLVNVVHDKIDKSDRAIIIIDDIRMKNEFDMLAAHGAVLVAVKRDTDKAPDNHVTENQIPELQSQCHWLIDNNGTLEKSIAEIEEIIKTVGAMT